MRSLLNEKCESCTSIKYMIFTFLAAENEALSKPLDDTKLRVSSSLISCQINPEAIEA